jgi:hypothetical protein
MAAIAFLVAYVAIAAAVISWCAAVFFYLKTQALLGPEQAHLRFMTLVAWPFAVGRLSGAARESANNVNKALVAFFLCLFVAGGAWGATFLFAVTGR